MALTLALLLLAPPATAISQIDSAYLDGQLVRFEVVEAQPGQKPFRFGPWRFGIRVVDAKPRDGRLNLYLVSPGQQHRAQGFAHLDHNDVINALPTAQGPVEWDVYWAIVLDPRLRRDLRSESDLLLEAHARFLPGDLFELEDVPGLGFLREFLKVSSLRDLARWRGRDGSLPRLVIVPAGFAIRAAAGPLEEPTEEVPAGAPSEP